ncbi:MAG: IS1595 family transposase [Daejeonella sp.]
MFRGISIIEFRKRFQTERDCLAYLLEKKHSKGYQCLHCGHHEYGKGKGWHYRRCKKCNYDESATAGTLFHKCKLGLLKAFEMAFRVSVRKKGMSSCELAKEFDCQQRSAWLWKAKIQESMKSSRKFELDGEVEVDEFMVGGFSLGKPGRSPEAKDLVVLVVEKVVNKKGETALGRAYCKTIDDASAESLKIIFKEHISKQAKVKTDGWRGYWPLQKDWDIVKEKSDKGANFPLLHTHIMNIKGWLRGIHHKCDSHRLQNYLDEYHFRFNRRSFLNSIFDKLISRMTECKPITYQMLKCELNT